MTIEDAPVVISLLLMLGMMVALVLFLIRSTKQGMAHRDVVLEKLQEVLQAEGNARRAVGRWKGREVVIDCFGEPRLQVGCGVRDVRVREVAMGNTVRVNRSRSGSRSENMLPSLGDLETGDALFDARFDVQGTLLPWIAGPVVALARAMPYGLTIDDGRVALPIAGMTEADIPRFLDGLVALATALDAQDKSLDQRALDPSLPAAQRAAALLQLAHGDLDAALAVALRFCDEGDVWLKVHGLEVLSRVDAVDPLGLDALRGALTLDELPLREVALQALGRAGTLDDVARIQALGVAEPGLERAARDAVSAIQARVGGRRGEVALANVEGGELSLTDPVAGDAPAPRPPPVPER